MTLLAQLQSATEGGAELEGRMWCEANGKIFVSAHEMDHFRPSGVQCMYRDKPRGRKEATRQGNVLRWTRDLQDAVSLAVTNDVNWLHALFQAAVAYDFEQSSRAVTPAVACLLICEAIIKTHESKEAEAA